MPFFRGTTVFSMRSKERKEKTKKSKTKKRKEKHINTKKELFSYQSIFWWVSKISFLTTWPKTRTQNHYENRGFSKAFLEKQMCVTKRPFWTKEPNPEIPVIIFLPILFSFNNKTQNLAETHILVVF